ncbi:MAG: U-box domain-containing protein [Proteobacteria bacterium]|nr:U-box domain-containing protein [Pseudomonadota bacterium]
MTTLMIWLSRRMGRSQESRSSRITRLGGRCRERREVDTGRVVENVRVKAEPELRALDELSRCPLTMEVFYDPVIDLQGHSFERRAIVKWLREKQESPITRMPMRVSDLRPNRALREFCQALPNLRKRFDRLVQNVESDDQMDEDSTWREVEGAR